MLTTTSAPQPPPPAQLPTEPPFHPIGATHHAPRMAVALPRADPALLAPLRAPSPSPSALAAPHTVQRCVLRVPRPALLCCALRCGRALIPPYCPLQLWDAPVTPQECVWVIIAQPGHVAAALELGQACRVGCDPGAPDGAVRQQGSLRTAVGGQHWDFSLGPEGAGSARTPRRPIPAASRPTTLFPHLQELISPSQTSLYPRIPTSG